MEGQWRVEFPENIQYQPVWSEDSGMVDWNKAS